LKRGIDLAVKAITARLQEMSRKVTSQKEIAQVVQSQQITMKPS